MRKLLIMYFVVGFLTTVTKAQTDSTGEKKLTLKPGLQFISNQTYAGRTDSLNLPVLIPSFSLITHGGFFTKIKGYMNLSTGNTGFDGISIEPGYEISKEHWDISFSLIKNFISDSSNLIIAPIKTSLEFYAGNRNKIINPYAGAEYLFTSEGNDVIVYGGVSKNFLFTKKEKEPSVSFEPSLSLTGGTQTFFYSYLKKYSVNSKSSGSSTHGRGRSYVPPIVTSQTLQQTVEAESKQFSLLSAEAEFPLDISKGKFDLIIDPSWAAPISLVNKGSAGTQQAKSYVFLNIDLSLNF